jgi:sulfite exporter TauE/SafE
MWITALAIGFAGSLHCLAMCSPLAIAVTNLRSPAFVNKIIYNAGRIFCYGILGAFFSSFGSLFRFSGFQNILTITLGAALIVIGIAGTSYIKIPVLSKGIQHLTASLKSLFSRFIKGNKAFSMIVLGMLNGLLPCGLTYLALTYCLTLNNGTEGFTFMLAFGAGTLPVMLGLTSVVQRLIMRFKIRTQSLTTIAMIAIGVLLMGRGMMVHYHGVKEETEVICK